MLFTKFLAMSLKPSVFVFILIFIGLIFVFKKKELKAGKILIILGFVFYYLFSIAPTADLILRPLESQYSPLEKKELNEADKIVMLLGGGKESDVPRASEVLKIYLEDSNPKIIISGKNPFDSEKKEAREVKEFLVERGVKPEDVILENESTNTFKSAERIKEMVGEEPFFLITSAYHMPRAMRTFQKMGTKPVSAPADFKIEKGYNLFDFFPSPKSLKKSNLAIHEYLGSLFYKFVFF